MTTIVLHPKVKEALLHPGRSTEVRGWLKTHHSTALAWRGEDGETMMHWAFLSDWALCLELRDVGLSYECLDHTGRTPFDWLTDRLWGAVVNPTTNKNLSKGGQERILKHSQDQAISLWSSGARMGTGTQKNKDTLRVWMSAGAFEVVSLLMRDLGAKEWLGDGGTILHALVLAPNVPARQKILGEALKVLDINVQDNNGRTPLWYATETWLKHPEKRHNMLALISLLMDSGANPFIVDSFDMSPQNLIAFDKDNEEIKKIILR